MEPTCICRVAYYTFRNTILLVVKTLYNSRFIVYITSLYPLLSFKTVISVLLSSQKVYICNQTDSF